MILQADGEVPHGEVLKVAGAVAQVEGITVHVGVQEQTGTPDGSDRTGRRDLWRAGTSSTPRAWSWSGG